MPSTPKRTFIKSITWETISTTATLILAWLMFGNFGGCVLFSIIAYFMKIIMFYYHDKFWHKVKYGKVS